MPLLIRSALLVAFTLSLAPAAWAADGRIEINQVSALAGGVTPGDTAGYPVTLSQGGSYVLTGDLWAGPGDAGIEVTATTPVSIDLKGFTLQGPNLCSGEGPSLSCQHNAGYGISASGGNLIVRNGVVRGFFGGVLAGPNSMLLGLTLAGNTNTGAQLGTGSLVRGVKASLNGGGPSGEGDDLRGPGLWLAEGSLVLDSTFHGNRMEGVSRFGPGEGSAVIASSVHGNGSGGVFLGEGSTVAHCQIEGNFGTGIQLRTGSLAIRNTSRNNVGSFQLRTEIFSGYVGNVLSTGTSGSGTVEDLSIFTDEYMFPNLCDGTTTCPFLIP